MVDKNVTLKFGVGDPVVLTNDLPNIHELVEFINKNRASIDISKIEVESESDSFDCESFKQVLSELISDYLTEIKLDRENYESIISGLSE